MNASSVPILELVKVEKFFGSFQALHGVSLEIPAGTVTCIVGPSGSGKSTLLRTINMLEPIQGGAIFFKGELCGEEVRNGYRVPVSAAKAREQVLNFGMVFQSFNLFPNMTALENVTLAPRTVRGLSREAAERAAIEHLSRVGLADKRNNYPNELSGGQQQRVAIARALAMQPEVMLFDEPTSALDPELVAEVLEVIRSLANDGTTMVIVTHEMNLASEIADQLVVMADGRIIEQGHPRDVLSHPATERGRAFFAAISGHHHGHIDRATASASPAAQQEIIATPGTRS
ncbi:amino acid ABC transporter ATP-binding protein [Georgenia yuyongxinii]|uniref:Amino acid ABC transporter ATP-binding protein n=1 Tax=Georgenia yuyongxinii TaxID=2589797 RepID=A0A552WT90_9MICO|nr:amino acid ABC transporter ATP-binding protein [Georgenia yuyongxinii]